MRFTPFCCPLCDEPASHIVEQVITHAAIRLVDDHDFDWTGHSEVDWNSQESVTDEDGRVELFCAPCQHAWRAHEEAQMKSREIIELEISALTVLSAAPDVPTYEQFRASFAAYLCSVHHFTDGRLERALIELDRGDIELPRSLPFSLPVFADRLLAAE